MKLFGFADIQSGYHSRGAIEAREDGSHLLLQARDVDAHRLTCSTEGLAWFTPALSRKDWPLQDGDILSMARGARNYALLLRELPDPDLAAACFFIVPLPSGEVQGKIADLDVLLRQEEDLLAQLMEKRRELITNTCLQAAR